MKEIELGCFLNLRPQLMPQFGFGLAFGDVKRKAERAERIE
jgi:hypothetical protein